MSYKTRNIVINPTNNKVNKAAKTNFGDKAFRCNNLLELFFIKEREDNKISEFNNKNPYNNVIRCEPIDMF